MVWVLQVRSTQSSGALYISRVDKNEETIYAQVCDKQVSINKVSKTNR